jgi:hypothetical protein
MRSSRVLELLTAVAEVATFLGLIQASSDTVESEGRQMKQCLIQYIRKNPKNLPGKISTIGKKISSDLYVCLLLQASFVPAAVGVSAV